MDDIEVAELLESLEVLLARLGLDSIVEQERTAASEGRVVEAARADLPRKRIRDQSQPAVGDVRRVPLSSRERLKILVDLAEVAVGGTFAIEERVHDFVGEYFADTDEEFPWTSFRSDRSEGFVLEDDRDWSLPDREALNDRRNKVQQVLADLDRLRELAELERSPELSVSRDFQDRVSERTLGWA